MLVAVVSRHLARLDHGSWLFQVGGLDSYLGRGHGPLFNYGTESIPTTGEEPMTFKSAPDVTRLHAADSARRTKTGASFLEAAIRSLPFSDLTHGRPWPGAGQDCCRLAPRLQLAAFQICLTRVAVGLFAPG